MHQDWENVMVRKRPGHLDQSRGLPTAGRRFKQDVSVMLQQLKDLLLLNPFGYLAVLTHDREAKRQ